MFGTVLCLAGLGQNCQSHCHFLDWKSSERRKTLFCHSVQCRNNPYLLQVTCGSNKYLNNNSTKKSYNILIWGTDVFVLYLTYNIYSVSQNVMLTPVIIQSMRKCDNFIPLTTDIDIIDILACKKFFSQINIISFSPCNLVAVCVLPVFYLWLAEESSKETVLQKWRRLHYVWSSLHTWERNGDHSSHQKTRFFYIYDSFRFLILW